MAPERVQGPVRLVDTAHGQVRRQEECPAWRRERVSWTNDTLKSAEGQSWRRWPRGVRGAELLPGTWRLFAARAGLP